MSTVRAAGGAVVGALALGAVLVGGAAPAWANHAEVIASADCTGTVAYTVTAWPGQPSTPEQPALNERSRTITDMDLEVSLDDGPYQVAVEHLSLGSDNGYSVTGTFTIPDGDLPETLVLRTVPRSPWATGAKGVARQSPVLDLSRCEGERVAVEGSSGDPDRRPLWLGGGLVGGLAAWFLTRPRGGSA